MAAQGEKEAQPLTLVHRSVAAAGAAVVSAFVVNPLDVVKTRIQAQGALQSAMPRSDTLLEKWSFAACECVRVQGPPPAPAAAAAAAGARPPVCGPSCSALYAGTWDGLTKIAQREGLGVLWRGTDVALMMAIPMVGIYLPLYDFLLQRCQETPPLAGAAAPLVAGTLARTAAVYCTAPFELVRTRLQAAAAAPAPAAAEPAVAGLGGGRSRRAALLLQHMPSPSAHGGSRLAAAGKLWTGVGATLARDVPFSALYWGMVEPIRAALLPPPGHRAGLPEWHVFAANVTAGSVAGGLAGAITTPFDVLKTRAQLSADKAHPLLSSLRTIASSEGLGALFRGWSARSAKAAPACAIVLSSYEMIKHIGDHA